jgi:hypothetical protein
MESRAEAGAGLGLLVARQLTQAKDSEWPEIFEGLRRTRQLSAAMHGINALLDDPAHRELAVTALRRVGLEYGG